jgi:carbon-monoxide dehydrogenase medium subunit
MLALLLDAQIRTASPQGGRTILARDFFAGALATALESAEIVVEVELPAPPAGAGWAFEETARRSGDFALAAVSAIVSQKDGRCAEARIAMMGVGETALRAHAAEAMLEGQPFDAELVQAAAEAAREAAEPTTDLHASADYRRHLVEVLTRRALGDACRRAAGRA